MTYLEQLLSNTGDGALDPNPNSSAPAPGTPLREDLVRECFPHPHDLYGEPYGNEY
jgi:hypothetical protein